MLALLVQIEGPIAGQDPLAWIAGLLAGACVALFTLMIKGKDGQITEGRENTKEARSELKITIDSLRTLVDAVDRNARDQASVAEGTKQAVIAQGADLRKLIDAVVILDRRLERIESDRRPAREAP